MQFASERVAGGRGKRGAELDSDARIPAKDRQSLSATGPKSQSSRAGVRGAAEDGDSDGLAGSSCSNDGTPLDPPPLPPLHERDTVNRHPGVRGYLCESHEIHAGPFLEQARRAMLHAQTQAMRLCVEEVAHALARQAITQKSLFLAHHHEHLCRQAYFLYKEHTARWFVEAQQAVYQLSWMADSRRLRFCQWRTAVLPKARSTALCKLAAASSCWEQAHVSLSTSIQADEASA